MSAAIKLIEQPNTGITPGDSREKTAESSFNNVSYFESPQEQRVRRAGSQHGQVGQLQAEVASLREELHLAERTIARYEQLLRNAMIRERELRSEMVKHIF